MQESRLPEIRCPPASYRRVTTPRPRFRRRDRTPALLVLLQAPHAGVDPACASSAAWVPRSRMRPDSRTRISSASTTVDSRCAMVRVVWLRAIARSSPWIAFSECESRALVASSKMRMRGALRIARAMATRCFSPPDSFRPRSPTVVSYPRAGSRRNRESARGAPPPRPRRVSRPACHTRCCIRWCR